MYVSIRTKILGVLSVLLVGAIFAYLLLANRIFREDKQLLVFDTNRSNVERLASYLEISLQRVLDKTEVVAKLVLRERGAAASKAPGELARDFFERDEELLLFQLFRRRTPPDGPAEYAPLRQIVGTYQLGQLKIPEQELLGDPELRVDAASVPAQVTVENISRAGAVLFRLRVPIQTGPGQGDAPLLAQVVTNGRRWLEEFQNQNLAFNFAVGQSGRVLVSGRAEAVAARQDMSSHVLVQMARSSNVSGQQLEFEAERTPYLGVFQKTSLGGLTVFSVTAKHAALSASLLLLEKTILLSLIVVTIVLLVSLWFARSISKPILELVRASGDIAKGRFDTRIEATTHDEIGELAAAFGRMARELGSSRLELETHSRALEEKVQARTRELEDKNVAIREQQDILVRANRLAAVGEAAGQAAHEVLNPLTGMIARLEALKGRLHDFRESGSALAALRLLCDGWQAELARGGVDGWLKGLAEPSKVYAGKSLAEEDALNLASALRLSESFATQLEQDVQQLLAEGFRISRIVDSMRGLTRLSSRRARVSLAGLVRESIHTSEDLLRRHDITIEGELEGGLEAVVEPDEMRQVFSNLIKNAMDAIRARRTGSGSRARERGKIRITGFKKEGKLFVRVWDNGTGIAPADRALVFETNFTTKGADGTGFGLSISRRFVRSAGGELVVRDSEVGMFTEFEITLPASDA